MKHNWTYKKLTDVAAINYGTRVVQKRDGGTIYPVYGGGDATFRMDTYNRENCLVVARFAMSPKCTRRVVGKFFLNDSGLTLEAKEGVCQDYLDWHIIALNDEIYRTAKGAAQKNLDVKTFTSLSIGVPSLDEQKAIVAELDGINRLIDLQEEQLREYDRLALSLFYTTFGDPVSNPKGWEVKKLGEVAEQLFAGGDVPKNDLSQERDENHPYPIYSNGVVQEGLYGYTGSARVSEPALTISARGTIGVVFKRNEPFFPVVRLLVLVPEKEVLGMDYTMYCLRTFNIENNGVAIPQLTVPMLKQYAIPLPPLALQQSFAAQIEAIEQQKALVRKSLEETRTLLAARMQYYFE